MQMDKIKIFISPNEKGSDRATHLALAASDDNRFDVPEFKDIPIDVLFQFRDKSFMAELKECPDYIASTLGISGHIALQYLDMAEAGHRCMFLVLGSDADVSQAIKDSLKTRYRGSELGFQIASYEKRLQDFEAQCEALRCPVDRWKAAPYSRLLSRVHKILTGASLAGYGPRPKDNEREIVACNCLFRGIGEKTLTEVLKEYRIALVPRKEYAKPIEEIKGVGEKRAKDIGKKIVMYYDGRL